ncbi:MAG: 5-formyltetrahydrofolate cyclo-ligase [Atopobiaceae bacterium]|jgi:5-formyltetrahydrofolate cyclo-ligase
MSSSLRKDALREKLLAKRAQLTGEKRVSLDSLICKNVCARPEFQETSVLACYLSMDSEVETRPLIRSAWSQGKTVVLPRVFPHRQLRWYKLEPTNNTALDEKTAGLEKSAFGVLEPKACLENELDLSSIKGTKGTVLAIVPGLCFDMKGYRLGYGGGFYDAFLSDFEGTSCGIARDMFVVDNLDSLEPHDVPVDMVISEKRSIMCSVK